MNAMDVRVIGASALTAAVVSVAVAVTTVAMRRDCPAPPPVVINQAPATVVTVLEEPTVDEPTNPDCDAERSKESGMERINLGMHAMALSFFEQSLGCKRDPYVLTLAFMESCASGNSYKAKLYFKQLTEAQQSKFAQICIRQKPPVPYQ